MTIWRLAMRVDVTVTQLADCGQCRNLAPRGDRRGLRPQYRLRRFVRHIRFLRHSMENRKRKRPQIIWPFPDDVLIPVRRTF